MSIIKITGSGAYEQTQEKNHALEYLRRCLTAHKEKSPLDHPDGSVSKEKLSPELRELLSKFNSDIGEQLIRIIALETDSHIHSNSEILSALIEVPPTQAELEALHTYVNSAIANIKSQTAQLSESKADKSTTLEGYGITNAYTKGEIDKLTSYIRLDIFDLKTHVKNVEAVLDEVIDYQENYPSDYILEAISPDGDDLIATPSQENFSIDTTE